MFAACVPFRGSVKLYGALSQLNPIPKQVSEICFCLTVSREASFSLEVIGSLLSHVDCTPPGRLRYPCLFKKLYRNNRTTSHLNTKQVRLLAPKIPRFQL